MFEQAFQQQQQHNKSVVCTCHAGSNVLRISMKIENGEIDILYSSQEDDTKVKIR